MDNKIKAFISLAELFKNNGYSLFLVGGTVRDYLLNVPLTDLDVVTNATPNDMKTFLIRANYTFERFGSVKLIYNNEKFDITTLRKEAIYSDSRHPGQVEFCDSLDIDVLRRDFTINAMYMDSKLEVIDLVSGQKDINNRIIRMIGNPEIRLKEDPLRIVRALRFKINLSFVLDDELYSSIKNNKDLLTKLNRQKIEEEIRKCHDSKKLRESLKDLNYLC